MGLRTWGAVCAVATMVALAPGFCRPAIADDRELCKTEKGDAAIAACTRAIESKKFKRKKFKRTLSLLYTNRGVEYEIKKEWDKATADHSEAIKVDPKNYAAYNNRGNAYAAKGSYDLAIADFDEAIKLKPEYADAYFNRSIAKRYKGDFSGADADVAQAKALDPALGN